MSRTTSSLIGLVGAVALVAVTTPTASAADTTTTFALVGGTLSVAVPASADLGSASSGVSAIKGSLGSTQVTDNRGVTLGWTASAASAGFTGAGGKTQSTGVTYSSGALTKTGTIVVTGSDTVPLTSSATPVVLGTLAVGNNTASWNPQLMVSLPADSLAGSYTGTVTTSVA